jgi:hypothetical protein
MATQLYLQTSLRCAFLLRLRVLPCLTCLPQGFGFLLTRQILFGMVKFLVFETFASAMYGTFPALSSSDSSTLLVSLLSGAVAGVCVCVRVWYASASVCRREIDCVVVRPMSVRCPSDVRPMSVRRLVWHRSDV